MFLDFVFIRHDDPCLLIRVFNLLLCMGSMIHSGLNIFSHLLSIWLELSMPLVFSFLASSTLIQAFLLPRPPHHLLGYTSIPIHLAITLEITESTLDLAKCDVTYSPSFFYGVRRC